MMTSTLLKKLFGLFLPFLGNFYFFVSFFFCLLTACLNKAAVKYKNIIIMGDFNLDIKNKVLGYGKLDTFCDLFNRTNLIPSETCLVKNQFFYSKINQKSTIDLFLTNKPKSFLRLIQLKQVWVITINLFLHSLNPKRQNWSQK